MSEWKAKRFWKSAQVVSCEGGYTVQLDGRPVKTPAKAALVVPTRAMAEAIAVEWDAQVKQIDPRTMPVTRGANAAIDKVRTQRAEVISLLAEYGDSDLLCYRAVGPQELCDRQVERWDPILEWSANTLNARLQIGQGVMHVTQDPAVLKRLQAALEELDDFALAAAHDLISLSGSLVLALAVMQAATPAAVAWRLSRVDEDWQIEQWGRDDDATAAEAIKCAAFLDAERFYRLSLAR